ncbi:hypothetical protein ABN214_15120 [Proteus terrae]|uniref:hypothetical protein n=1 Tax=Proteus terrae TaxID=1574161 RepID=UPI0032DA12FA
MKQLLTGYTVNNSLGKSGLFGIMGSFVKIDKNNEPVKTYHNWEVGSNVEHRFVKSISAALDTIIAHNAQQAPAGKSVASINIIDEVVVVDVETYMEDGRKLYSSVISLDGVVINEFPTLCKKIISCDEGIRNCYWQVWAPEGYRHWTNSNGIHQITCEKTLAALNKAHVELTGVSIEQAGLGGLNHVVASIITAETPDRNPKVQVLTMPFELTSHENPYVMTSISKIKLWLKEASVVNTCKTVLQTVTISGDVVVGHFAHKNVLDPNLFSCTALVYVQGNRVSLSTTTTNTTDTVTAEAAIRGAYKLAYAKVTKEGGIVGNGNTLILSNAYNLLMDKLISQGVDVNTLPGICSDVDKGKILTAPSPETDGITLTSVATGGLNRAVATIIAAETPIDKSKLTDISLGDVLVGFNGNNQSTAEVLGVYACNSDGIKQMADDLLKHDANKTESRSAAASLLSPTGFEPQGGINSSAERCSMVGKSTASKATDSADFVAGIRSLDQSKVSFMVTQFETPKVCYEDINDDEDDIVVKYISRPVLLDEESGECVVVSEEDWLTGNAEANLFSVYAVCDSGEHVCVADFDTKEASDAVARTLNQLHRL